MNNFTSSQCCHRRTDVCGAPGWGWGNPLPRRTERPHHGQSHPLSRRRTPSRRRRASGRPSLQTSKHKSMVTTCWLVMLVWLCCGRYTVWDSSFQNSKAMKADTEFETRAQKTLQLLKYLFLVQQPLTQTVFEATHDSTLQVLWCMLWDKRSNGGPLRLSTVMAWSHSP